MKWDARLILFGIVFILIGYVTGYMLATSQVMHLCISTGERLLDIKLNENAASILMQRFPEIIELLKNHDAPLLNDSWH